MMFVYVLCSIVVLLVLLLRDVEEEFLRHSLVLGLCGGERHRLGGTETKRSEREDKKKMTTYKEPQDSLLLYSL